MSRLFRSSKVPHRNQRSDHPALQAAARLPAYIVLALMIVAVSAGGLVAARGDAPESPTPAAADVAESELPTPVPPSETPLPTPVPLDQSTIVDTAVAFWVEFVPEELALEYREEILAAGGVPWLRSASVAGATASTTPVPAPTPTATAAADPGDGGTAPTEVTEVTEVQLTPPSDLATVAPLPAAPLPSAEPLETPILLPLPTPTLPPLLP